MTRTSSRAAGLLLGAVLVTGFAGAAPDEASSFRRGFSAVAKKAVEAVVFIRPAISGSKSAI